MTVIDHNRMQSLSAESMSATADQLTHLADVVARVYGQGFSHDDEPKELPGGVTAFTADRQVTLTQTRAPLDNQRRTTLWTEDGVWHVATEVITPVRGSAFNNGSARVVRTTQPLAVGVDQTVAAYDAAIVHAPEVDFNRSGRAVGSRLVVDYDKPVDARELPAMSGETCEAFAGQLQGMADAVDAVRQQSMAAGEQHAAKIEQDRRGGFLRRALGNVATALWRPVGHR